MLGLIMAVRRLAVRSECSCFSRVAAKAAGLEKSRFFKVNSTNSVAIFSVLSETFSCRSLVYLFSAA